MAVLAPAIRTVVAGGCWFNQVMMAQLLFPPAPLPTLLGLTEREQAILDLIAHGKDNGTIAHELCLCHQTVRNYVSQLYAKLGVSTRAEALVWAREHQGIV